MQTKILWPVIVLALAPALAGCERPGPAPTATDKAAPASVATSKTAARPQLAETSGELPLADLTGIWRVVGVIPDKGSAFSRDDPQITGSLMDITEDQIRWSYQAGLGLGAGDLCLGTVAGLIDDSEYADKARQMLAPAVADRRTAAVTLSPPHQWLCGDGGEWGNETEFQLVADGRMVMRWDGGVTLVLERIRKIAAEPGELAPTGAYEAD